MSHFLPPTNKVCEGYVFTGVCLSTGESQSLSRGVSVLGGPCPGGLCLVVSVQASLSRGSLIRGGLYPGVSVQGISVQGGSLSWLGGLCPEGSLCPWGSLYRGVSVKGSLSRGSLSMGVSVKWGLCIRGTSVWGLFVHRRVSV